MKSILIRDTTREEREQIVRRSLWGDAGLIVNSARDAIIVEEER